MMKDTGTAVPLGSFNLWNLEKNAQEQMDNR